MTPLPPNSFPRIADIFPLHFTHTPAVLPIKDAFRLILLENTGFGWRAAHILATQLLRPFKGASRYPEGMHARDETPCVLLLLTIFPACVWTSFTPLTAPVVISPQSS